MGLAGVLGALVAGGCLRTDGGGCGGPTPGAPCECPDVQVSVEPVAAGTPETVPAEPGGTVVIHAEVEPAHLMPLLRPDAWSERVVAHDVYESLIRQDPFSHEYVPELAESYEVSPDGLTMTFHLRGEVRWHDGEPFTSNDVLYTFDMVRDPSSLAATARSNLECVASYAAPDPLTFTVTLREPTYFVLSYIESLTILPRHVFESGDINSHSGLRRPVGTGPFRFVEWREGREVTLARNESYWGKKASLDRVVYRFARDKTLALQMLKRGDIDLMPRLTPAQVEQARADRDLLRTHTLTTQFAPGFSFFVYNTKRPQFADPTVRRALTQLVDRSTVLCSLEGCLGRVISSPLPIGHPGIDPEVRAWPFDPVGAGRLLDRAGWRSPGRGRPRERGGRRLEFTLLVPSVSASSQRVATLVQEDLTRAGVRMDIRDVDWAVFLERLGDHDFDAAALQLTLDWETDYYVLYHSSQAAGGMNYGSFENAEVDRIVVQLRREFDQRRRRDLYRRLHRLLHREQPATFLLARVESSLVPKSLSGARPGIPWFDERSFSIPRAARRPDGRPAR